MTLAPVDLQRVRSALDRLDRLAVAHPQLVAAGVAAEDWLDLFATEINLKPQTYSTEELANLVGLHPETIRREIKRGKLKAAMIGGRVSRISAVEAAAWWEAAGGGKLWDGEPPAPGETSEPSK